MKKRLSLSSLAVSGGINPSLSESIGEDLSSEISSISSIMIGSSSLLCASSFFLAFFSSRLFSLSLGFYCLYPFPSMKIRSASFLAGSSFFMVD
jgi:hypothetical protein